MTLCSNLAYDKNILYVLVPSIDFFFLLIGDNERVEGIQTLKQKVCFVVVLTNILFTTIIRTWNDKQLPYL